jgi:hypothetical protein
MRAAVFLALMTGVLVCGGAADMPTRSDRAEPPDAPDDVLACRVLARRELPNPMWRRSNAQRRSGGGRLRGVSRCKGARQ